MKVLDHSDNCGCLRNPPEAYLLAHDIPTTQIAIDEYAVNNHHRRAPRLVTLHEEPATPHWNSKNLRQFRGGSTHNRTYIAFCPFRRVYNRSQFHGMLDGHHCR